MSAQRLSPPKRFAYVRFSRVGYQNASSASTPVYTAGHVAPPPAFGEFRARVFQPHRTFGRAAKISEGQVIRMRQSRFCARRLGISTPTVGSVPPIVASRFGLAQGAFIASVITACWPVHAQRPSRPDTSAARESAVHGRRSTVRTGPWAAAPPMLRRTHSRHHDLRTPASPRAIRSPAFGRSRPARTPLSKMHVLWLGSNRSRSDHAWRRDNLRRLPVEAGNRSNSRLKCVGFASADRPVSWLARLSHQAGGIGPRHKVA